MDVFKILRSLREVVKSPSVICMHLWNGSLAPDGFVLPNTGSKGCVDDVSQLLSPIRKVVRKFRLQGGKMYPGLGRQIALQECASQIRTDLREEVGAEKTWEILTFPDIRKSLPLLVFSVDSELPVMVLVGRYDLCKNIESNASLISAGARRIAR